MKAKKSIWLLCLLTALLCLWNCQVGEDKSNQALVTIETDSTYFRFGKLWVGYTDSTGHDTTVIWGKDSLPAGEDLHKVQVTIPPGGVIQIIIRGYQAGSGNLVYEEIRVVNLTTGEETGNSIPIDLTKPGLRAPKVAFSDSDTVISIGDGVDFLARVTDSDGVVFSYAWDLEGSGKYGAEFAYDKDSSILRTSHNFPVVGQYNAIVRLKDATRKAYFDTVRVTVLQDPPKAEAGQNVGVMVRQTVHLHGEGHDSMGQVVTYEWKLGNGEFSASKNGDTSFAAPQDPVEQHWTLRVTDDDGNQTVDSVIVSVSYGTDAYLATLSATGVKLSPDFERTKVSYSGSAPYSMDSLEIHLNPEDPTAHVRVGGVDLAGKDSVKKVALQTGGNLISISVTAQNGADTVGYSVYISRSKNDDANLASLSIGPGTLVPGFSKGQFDYSVSLDNGQRSLAVIPFASDAAHSKIFVNQVPRISGVVGDSIPVHIGVDTVKIEVTAQDDSTKRSYRIVVSRLPSPDATLKNIELSVGAIIPGFSPAILRYSDTVANTITGIALKPTLGNPNSKLLLNGNQISSGTFTGAIPLVVGDTPFQLRVVAETGDTGEYVLTIHRRSADVGLAELSITPGTMKPAFAIGQSAYSDTVSAVVDTVFVSMRASHAGVRSIKIGDRIANSAEYSGAFPIALGANAFIITVTAEDGNSSIYSMSVYRRNGDATLKGLEPSVGTLVPPFAPGNEFYTITLGNGLTSISFKPSSNSPLATVSLVGKKIIGGAFSDSTHLPTGDSPFILTVVSENGDSSHYSIRVHRKSTDARLVTLRADKGVLRPTFISGVMTYRDTVPAGTPSILLTAVAADSFAQSITIQGTTIPNDTASLSIPFSGIKVPVEAKVIVKAEEGNESTYTVKFYGPGFIKVMGSTNDDDAFSITPTKDGGYVFAQVMTNSGAVYGSDLIKMNSDGDTIWVRTFESESGIVLDLSVAANGDITICGWGATPDGNDFDFFLAKVDIDGKMLWEKFFGQVGKIEGANSIVATNDGGFILVGFQMADPSIASHDIRVVKTNASGDTAWTRTFGTSSEDEYPNSIIQLQDNGYLITGYIRASGGDSRTFLLRLDASGNSVWMKTYEGAAYIGGRSVEVASDGGFLVASSSNRASGNDLDCSVLKTNQNGDSLWTKFYGAAGSDGFYSISKISGGGFALAGNISIGGGTDVDAYLVITDADLNVKWSKTYGGSQTDLFRSSAQLPDGSFILGGSSASFGGTKRELLIIKTDDKGNAE
jgi:hypothetical protein